ncbi:UNVERIFIED_CONTAM: hypothetical protein B566_EDAN014214 [Ephemera danica]|nr:hypothetical protein B566_EDAN014214 [Ephemera danica]
MCFLRTAPACLEHTCVFFFSSCVSFSPSHHLGHLQEAAASLAALNIPRVLRCPSFTSSIEAGRKSIHALDLLHSYLLPAPSYYSVGGIPFVLLEGWVVTCRQTLCGAGLTYHCSGQSSRVKLSLSLYSMVIMKSVQETCQDSGVESGRVTKIRHTPRNVENEEIQMYLSKLKELVPFMPKNRKLSKLEVIQYVIDYICDLQSALDTHPAISAAAVAAAAVNSAAVAVAAATSRQPLDCTSGRKGRHT